MLQRRPGAADSDAENRTPRFLHDLVVTMIFAFHLERLSPSVAILQVRAAVTPVATPEQTRLWAVLH